MAVVAIAGICLLFVVVLCLGQVVESKSKRLLEEILLNLGLENIDNILREYDDHVVVKSLQALNNYSDIKYLKDTGKFDLVRKVSGIKVDIRYRLTLFLHRNNYMDNPLYFKVRPILENYVRMAEGYKISVEYITTAGNKRGSGAMQITPKRVQEIASHPEYLMSKGEYQKWLKEQEKQNLEKKKRVLYERVNAIIEDANTARDKLVVKANVRALDELIQKLYDNTVNHIQKISGAQNGEWYTITKMIDTLDLRIKETIEKDKRISDYYTSEAFEKIKQTCELITRSQKEFNEYIDTKRRSIISLFGSRVVREETEVNDAYNYIRPYHKAVSPFTAEVSNAVFSSAENNPIDYIIKYFYPNRSQYKTQIDNLRLLIEEWATLRDAKEIIEKYKKDYSQYIQDVPKYVLEDDEDGFYSRLGLTIIDESTFNIEYRFTYTSNGGIVQRSFAFPMTEDNIIALIQRLENKMTHTALAKEQRALMTSKLRDQIKKRDNYTCCLCGNSVYKEPNLLLEIDHIIPVAKGGLTKEDNLQTLCWKCNRSKGAKMLPIK